MSRSIRGWNWIWWISCMPHPHESRRSSTQFFFEMVRGYVRWANISSLNIFKIITFDIFLQISYSILILLFHILDLLQTSIIIEFSWEPLSPGLLAAVVIELIHLFVFHRALYCAVWWVVSSINAKMVTMEVLICVFWSVLLLIHMFLHYFRLEFVFI